MMGLCGYCIYYQPTSRDMQRGMCYVQKDENGVCYSTTAGMTACGFFYKPIVSPPKPPAEDQVISEEELSELL